MRPGRRPGQHRAALPGRDERVPHRRVLEHRAQVHRRLARQVDEGRRRGRRDVGLVERIGPAQHVEPTDLGAERRRTSASAASTSALGVLVGGRRSGSTSTSSAPLGSRSSRSKSQPSLPLAATDQGEGPGIGGDATRRRVLDARSGYPSVASRPMTIERVGIVGSGIMGSGIAEVAAKAGIDVVLRSRKQETADAMVAALEKSLAKQVERGKLEEDRDAKAIGRGSAPPHDLHALPTATSCIESVVEDLAVKKELFTRARRHRARPRPSSPPTRRPCPVVEMAVATERPEQVCGIHFFNPAPMMSLVEVDPAAHRVRRHGRRRPRRSPTACGKDAGRGEGPRRLHRQRAAVPVPQQRRADAREPAPPAATTSTPP